MGGLGGWPGSLMILSFSWEDSASMPAIKEPWEMMRHRSKCTEVFTPAEDAIFPFFICFSAL